MRIAIVGTGYVGLVSGACLSEVGHSVVCLDVDAVKIEKLRGGEVTIYEPGLEEMVERNVSAGRLSFTTDYTEALNHAEVVMIAVGTPSMAEGAVDMKYVEACAHQIGKHLSGYAVVVDKSTVPVGTGEWVASVIATETTHSFDVVSVPEFLSEGRAVQDFMEPSRIVIGTSSARATEVVMKMFAPFSCPKLVMDVRSAELTKYAANTFLAIKIGFINEIASLCERIGADVEQVVQGIGHDPRIGKEFLQAGLGWGGSCFPKDVRAVNFLGEGLQVRLPIIKASLEMNIMCRERVALRLEKALGGLQGKRVAVLGIAFKPNTDDTRESSAIALMKMFVERGAEVCAYDPIAKFAPEEHGFSITVAANVADVVRGADAVVLATAWGEFRTMDLAQLRTGMAGNVFFDARNIFDGSVVRAAGFSYLRVGQKET